MEKKNTLAKEDLNPKPDEQLDVPPVPAGPMFATEEEVMSASDENWYYEPFWGIDLTTW